MFSVTVWIFLLVAFLAYFLLKPKKPDVNLPGPFPLPLVGNMLEMTGSFWKVLVKWQRKHGPLIKIKIGGDTVVVVGDPALAKEMCSTDAFVGRAFVDEFLLFEGKNIGLINSEGELWEQQRRFVVRQLRDFGFGKSSMESVIMEEVNDLTSRLISKFNGKPIENIRSELQMAMVNALWNIVAGTRYSQEDEKLRKLARQLSGAFDEAAKAGGVIAFLPSLKYVIPEWSGYNAIRRLMKQLATFVGQTVADHKKTLQEDSPRDFIDVYLNEIKKTTNPASSFYGDAAEQQLIAVVADLYQAGADATSTVLNWGILYLTKFPDIQKKFYEEIQAVVGTSRPVSLTDRPKLLYAQAFINETLRKTAPPFGVPHRVLFDYHFQGVFYPKNTTVMFNLGFIHNDPNLWCDPEKFCPERFLSEDGKSLKKNDNFNLNPFLVGRRQCPGETLAKDTLFLYLANLVQKFNLVPDPDKPDIDLEPALSFMIQPKPFNVIFDERKDD